LHGAEDRAFNLASVFHSTPIWYDYAYFSQDFAPFGTKWRRQWLRLVLGYLIVTAKISQQPFNFVLGAGMSDLFLSQI
jgi:hypothetical protein